MSLSGIHPIPYPAVNAVLDELCSNVQAILGDQMIGIYLDGSLVMGDFNPQTSDIDFVVVTADELPSEILSELADMHARLAVGFLPWGNELEGSYIPLRALRRYEPENATHPNIQRGGRLNVEYHGSDWVIHRYILREHGVPLAGPPPQALIDPLLPDDLRQAVLGLLGEWWAPMLNNQAHLQSRDYQNYTILTMCRALYTLRHGEVVSKPVAARWAQATLGEPWAEIIKSALNWPQDTRRNKKNEAQAFIRLTLENAGLAK
jgi:hypothetical protein